MSTCLDVILSPSASLRIDSAKNLGRLGAANDTEDKRVVE